MDFAGYHFNGGLQFFVIKYHILGDVQRVDAVLGPLFEMNGDVHAFPVFGKGHIRARDVGFEITAISVFVEDGVQVRAELGFIVAPADKPPAGFCFYGFFQRT